MHLMKYTKCNDTIYYIILALVKVFNLKSKTIDVPSGVSAQGEHFLLRYSDYILMILKILLLIVVFFLIDDDQNLYLKINFYQGLFIFT